MGYGMLDNSFARSLGVIAGLGVAMSAAVAQDYPIDWVTIDDVGNPAYDDPWNGLVDGRGSVGYEYRIGRYEVTTGQWMEFVNTFSTQSDDLMSFGRPYHWGATIDWDYDGPGIRWKLRNDPDAVMRPVHGLDWRIAAKYSNWLHNDRSSALDALEDGAYDASTFTLNSDGTFNDQPTHNPDARFWIPTLDEWAKAAHYDPNRYGQGEGGWWDYANASDSPLIPGLPGQGDTSGTLRWEGADIPLGAYQEDASPWGLYDLSGGTMEWTEEVHPNRRLRWADGAALFAYADWLLADRVDQMGTEVPWAGGTMMGLRLVSSVPTPSTIIITALGGVMFMRTSRRRVACPGKKRGRKGVRNHCVA